MKQYPEYKNSGVEWIGEIPNDWEMRKVSRSFNIIGSGATPKSDNTDYYENATISWVITGDLNDGVLNGTSKLVNEMALAVNSSLKLYPKRTLLIAMYGATIGKICLINFQGCTNQACCAIADSPYFDNRFAFYWFLASRKHIINLSKGGGQPNISQEIIKSLKLPSPSLSEQKFIISYLDNKTQQIDTLIEKKQKQIELLKEQRTAIINQAVTKGLDPNVKMKDSGIEWIGEIPRNWNLTCLKRLCNKITDGSHFSPEITDEGFPYITVQDIKDKTIDFDNCKYISREDYLSLERNGCKPNKGDVLLTKDGTIGKSIVINDDKEFVILSSIGLLTPNYAKITAGYLRYYLISGINVDQMLSSIHGAALTRLTIKLIKELIAVYPSTAEQYSIANFLDHKTQQIDTLIDKIGKQIALYKEYRTTLISDVVTGKIDVRDKV